MNRFLMSIYLFYCSIGQAFMFIMPGIICGLLLTQFNIQGFDRITLIVAAAAGTHYQFLVLKQRIEQAKRLTGQVTDKKNEVDPLMEQPTPTQPTQPAPVQPTPPMPSPMKMKRGKR